MQVVFDMKAEMGCMRKAMINTGMSFDPQCANAKGAIRQRKAEEQVRRNSQEEQVK